MSLKFALLKLTLMIIIASCGPRSGAGEDLEKDEFQGQYLVGTCGLDVVYEFNKAVLECPKVMNRFQAIRCDIKLSQFENQFTGINCTAIKDYRLDGRDGDINQLLLDEYQDVARMIIEQGVL